MRILVAEDDFTSRLLLQEVLKVYGRVDLAVDGEEAVTAFREAIEGGQAYDLVCLDIMMPLKNVQEALREMRSLEENAGVLSSKGAKIVMTTALSDPRNVMESYHSLFDAYLVKPVDREVLIGELARLGFVQS